MLGIGMRIGIGWVFVQNNILVFGIGIHPSLGLGLGRSVRIVVSLAIRKGIGPHAGVGIGLGGRKGLGTGTGARAGVCTGIGACAGVGGHRCRKR